VSLLIAAIAAIGALLIVGVPLGLFSDLDPATKERRRRAEAARRVERLDRGVSLEEASPPPTGFAATIANLEADLVEAGMPAVTPFRWLLYTVGASGAVVGVVGIVLGSPLFAIAGSIGTFYFLRTVYLGRAATARRGMVTRQTAEACRAVANGINEGQSAEKAIDGYANRARTNSATAILFGEEPIVAGALLRAQVMISDQSIATEPAYDEVARDLGNKAFSTMVETYLQFFRQDHKAMARALESVAGEIEWTLQLRNERKTYLSQPIANYKMLGGINAALAVVLSQIQPKTLEFLRTTPGQVMAMMAVGWWLIGYRLQLNKLKERD
jgi:Flp pilus assembly protein TadB